MPATLDVLTGPGTLDDIQDVVKRFWLRHPRIPERIRLHLELAAVEIGANIVEHSAGGRPVRMRMAVAATETEVRVTFLDDGGPFEVDLGSVDMPPGLAERGRGLAIAIGVLDRLCYRRDPRGNHWTLTCSIG